MDAAAQPAENTEARYPRSVLAGTNASVDSIEPASVRYSRRYQPLVAVTLAVAAGIIWDRFGPRHVLAGGVDSTRSSGWFVVWWSLSAGCLVLWWLAWRREHDGAAAWVLLVAAAIAGSAWHEANWFLFDRNEIARYADVEPGPVCIEAVARESPERVSAPRSTPLRAIPVGERSRLLVEVTRIRDGRQWQPATGTCQLAVEGHLLGVHQGDQVRVFGQMARTAPPLNPGEFDFAAHARADRQMVRVRSSSREGVSIVEHGGVWNPSHLLDAVRVCAKQLVRSMIGRERAGLAAAILLGAREGLPYEETESYLVTGTIHVLVVSGMNVAILATGLLGLMQMGWMSRRAGLSLIAAIVVVYALLAEAQPPVVRAAVLGVLMCIAAWSGRRGVAFNSVFAAALIVLAINPNDLFRAGPQLSFLAVATLIWIGNAALLGKTEVPDRLEEMLAALRPWYLRAVSGGSVWLRWLLLTSIAVWLTTLPLVLIRFHVVSPIAILISPAIWFFVFAAMWSGFIMLVIGWIIPPIGIMCSAICNWSLAGLESTVEWAESVPAGHAWLPGPAWWWVAVFYVGL